MTFDEMNAAYAAIEEAVANKEAVRLPDGVMIQTTMFLSGDLRVEGLYWMDERRNIYQARLEPQCRWNGAFAVAGMYVNGNCQPDGLCSGRTDMFKKENRYKTII